MVLGIEIALAVYGLFGLIGGTLIISKTRVVQRLRARLLGLLALVPIAAAFVLIFAISNESTRTAIEIAIVAVFAVLVFALGALLSVNPDQQPQVTEETNDEMVEEDEISDIDELPEDAEQEAESAEPDIELTDSAQPASTGPESSHLDYFDTIAEHLEYFDMNPNPEQLDYFDTKPAKPDRSGASADSLDDLDPDPTPPRHEPPRPENRTSFM
jgi:hypothetical protein